MDSSSSGMESALTQISTLLNNEDALSKIKNIIGAMPSRNDNANESEENGSGQQDLLSDLFSAFASNNTPVQKENNRSMNVSSTPDIDKLVNALGGHNPAARNKTPNDGLASLAALLGGSGSGGMSQLTGLLTPGEGGKPGLIAGGDPRDALLNAIEPFLKPEKREKLQSARKLMRLAGLASLFQDLKL